MRTQLGNIVNSTQALAKLVGGQLPDGTPIASPHCSAQTAYALSLLRKAVLEQFEYFEAQRKQLWAEVDRSLPEEVAESYRRLEELLAVEVLLPNVGRIKLSTLQTEQIELNVQDYLDLAWLIKPDLPSIFEEAEVTA